MVGEELLVATEAIGGFHKVETSANGVPYLDEQYVSDTLRVLHCIENNLVKGLGTTAKIIVKSSHQKARTMKMRVNRRRSKKMITRTRKKVVRPLMGDSQLPWAEAMARIRDGQYVLPVIILVHRLGHRRWRFRARTWGP